MFCKNCGKEILGNGTYCPVCGTKIERAVSKSGFEDIHNKMENQEVWRKSIFVKISGIVSMVVAFMSLFMSWLKAKVNYTISDSYNFFELMDEADKAIVCVLPIISILIYILFQIKKKSKLSLIGYAGMIITIILYIFTVQSTPNHKYFSYAGGFIVFVATTVIVGAVEFWKSKNN